MRVPIADSDTAGDVHDRLMLLGARLVTETVDRILDGTVTSVPQRELAPGTELHGAPKIFKETCRINWQQGAKSVYDFVRGLSPYPAAWTELHHGGKVSTLKVYACEKQFCTPTAAPGQVETDGQSRMRIAVADGYVALTDVQIAGKRRMPIADFLRGFHPDGDCHVE